MPIPVSVLASVVQSLVELVPVRDSGKYFCTGVRIHADWILTSAHCVDQIKSLEVKPHGASLADTVVVSPDQVIVDKAYYDDCSFHDLALIRLTNKKQKAFSVLDHSAKFDSGLNADAYRFGLSLDTTGGAGGKKPVLVKRPIGWVDGKLNFDPIAKNSFAKENLQMLLFKNEETRVGHSGGPIIVVEKGQAKLFGIHSGTKGGPRGDEFGYAATVFTHLEWIQSMMKKYSGRVAVNSNSAVAVTAGVVGVGGSASVGASAGAVGGAHKICPVNVPAIEPATSSP